MDNTQTYRGFMVINGSSHFTKKLTLEKAIEWVQVMAMNGWCAGIIDGELPLPDAQAVFTDVIEPKNGWEE